MIIEYQTIAIAEGTCDCSNCDDLIAPGEKFVLQVFVQEDGSKEVVTFHCKCEEDDPEPDPGNVDIPVAEPEKIDLEGGVALQAA